MGNQDALKRMESKRMKYLDSVIAYLERRGEKVRGVRAVRGGVRTLVFKCELSDKGHIALKGYKRFYDYWMNLRASRFLRKVGVLVPEVLWADCIPFTRLKYRMYLIAERWVEGTHISMVDAEFGRALARLHSVENKRWGYPGLGRPGSFESSLFKELKEKARKIEEVGFLPAERIVEWFWAHLPERPTNYNLLHGRINKRNAIRSAGKIYWIDLGKVRFGSFPYELVRAYYRIGGDRDSFLNAYFGDDNERKERFERERLFYEMEFLLSSVNFRLRRLLRGKRGNYTVSRLEHHLAELVNSITQS